MNASVKFTLRLLLALGAITVLSLAARPPASDVGPYTSALSDPTVGTAQASPCPNTRCIVLPNRPDICIPFPNEGCIKTGSECAIFQLICS
jgi:hypothetical protein